MSDSIAALTPAQLPVRPAPAYDGAPDAGEMKFRELWQNPDEGMTFGDFLDIINPLQHIPVVSTIYRLVTGDEISQGARMVGSVLFGGPTGLISSGLMAAFEEASGDRVEGHLAALFGGDAPAAGPAAPQQAGAAPVAAAEPPPVPEPPPPGPPGAAAPANPIAFAPRGTAAHGFPAWPEGIVRNAPPAPVPLRFQPVPSRAAAPVARHTQDRNAGEATGGDRAQSGKDAAERRRIAESVARAQQAQAALLLSSIGGPDRAERKADGDGGDTPPAAAATAPAQPFRPHPYLLPPGASPEMVTRAMERALSKYRQGMQARDAAK